VNLIRSRAKKKELAAIRSWTENLQIFSLSLYQLSYRGLVEKHFLIRRMSFKSLTEHQTRAEDPKSGKDCDRHPAASNRHNSQGIEASIMGATSRVATLTGKNARSAGKQQNLPSRAHPWLRCFRIPLTNTTTHLLMSSLHRLGFCWSGCINKVPWCSWLSHLLNTQ
jgi:hypothetical protein